MNSGSNTLDHSRSFLNNRHDRSMIRLCALLWILKIQEDCYERRKAQNRHEGLQQPLKSEELLEGVATGYNTPNQVK